MFDGNQAFFLIIGNVHDNALSDFEVRFGI